MKKEMFSEKAKIILTFLQSHQDEEYTAKNIASITGLTNQQVNGTITASLQARGFSTRESREGIEDKVIVLTESGKTIDPNTVVNDTE